MKNKKTFCSCGFPQSYPIPHEHDRTDRENIIIAHYEQAIVNARIEVIDGILGECIAFSPKTREIDTKLTRRLLKNYEAQLKGKENVKI